MSEVRIDQAAEDDLLEIWAYIARDNPEAGDRVLEAAYQTFEALGQNPGLGVTFWSRNPKLRGTRQFVLTDFPNYVIFYRNIEERIEILRVVHGARDIDRLA